MKFVMTVKAGRSFVAFDEEEVMAEITKRLVDKNMEREYAAALVVDFARHASSCGDAFVDQPLASPTEVASVVCDVPAVPEVEGEDDDDAEYVLAFTHNRKSVRLRRARGCWRARKREFRDFELVDADALKADMYHDYCRKCWPS